MSDEFSCAARWELVGLTPPSGLFQWSGQVVVSGPLWRFGDGGVNEEPPQATFHKANQSNPPFLVLPYFPLPSSDGWLWRGAGNTPHRLSSPHFWKLRLHWCKPHLMCNGWKGTQPGALFQRPRQENVVGDVREGRSSSGAPTSSTLMWRRRGGCLKRNFTERFPECVSNQARVSLTATSCWPFTNTG